MIDSRRAISTQADLLKGEIDALHSRFIADETKVEWWIVGMDQRYRDYAANWQGKKLDTALKQAEAKIYRLSEYVAENLAKEGAAEGTGRLAGKALEIGGTALVGVSVWIAGTRRYHSSWKQAAIKEYKGPSAGLIALAKSLGGVEKLHGHHIVMKGEWKQWFHKELRLVLKESRQILKDAGIDYRDDIRNLTLAVNHHKNHSLEYATEVLKRLKLAAKRAEVAGTDSTDEVASALQRIRNELSEGRFIVPK